MTALDPRPEGSWAFRRLYVFGGALLGYGLLAYLAIRLEGQRELLWLALALIARDAWRETVYLVAPSAQAMVAGLRAWRGLGSGGAA